MKCAKECIAILQDHNAANVLKMFIENLHRDALCSHTHLMSFVLPTYTQWSIAKNQIRYLEYSYIGGIIIIRLKQGRYD